MAFIAKNFQPIGGQSQATNAPQVFSYSTLDAHADVDTSGYFNSVSSLVRPGDIINVVVWATAVGTGTISTYGPHIVMTNASGVVNVSAVTVGVVTNSD